jgi:AcrR family transcriptional regulator
MPPGERREQLMDAALRVIVEHGYEGLSIEAIARAAGVTRPVIYDHFGNLPGLLRTLIEREESYALAQLAAVVPVSQPYGSPAQLVTAGLRHFLGAVATRPDTWRIILLPAEGTPPIVREHVETNRARVLQRLQEIIRWALRNRSDAADLDIEIFARALMRLVEEAGRMVLTDPDRFSPERYERFVESIVGMIEAPRRRPRA